ncbi:dihydroorotase [Flavobacteriaceae bacterium F08102]|nr:dihydroorotase [Flavobacteriaceae bacterium F08102]
MNVLIKAATIIDQDSQFHKQKCDIRIENGKITAIGPTLKNETRYKEINEPNLHVSSGWFDSAVCFGEPGFEERETLENGLRVAASSGFTTIALNPNTHPVIDNKSAVKFLKNAADKSLVDLHPIANLTQGGQGKELAELYDMSQTGAIAFGDYNHPIDNANLLKIALQYCQNFNGLTLSFPQNSSIRNNGYVNEGEQSTVLGLKGNPALAEELQVSRDLFLLEYTGGKLHIPTITTAKSVRLIAEAKKKGLDISCSVSAFHLSLTDKEIEDFNTNVKINPPLRSKSDLLALRKGLINGTIDMLVSDHVPVDIENKKVAFELAMDGSLGLESLFGVANKVLPLEILIAAITKHPRKRFGLAPSTIAVGESANLTFFNPDETFTFSEKHLLSTSKNSAFLGKTLKGKVYGVFNNNKLHIN